MERGHYEKERQKGTGNFTCSYDDDCLRKHKEVQNDTGKTIVTSSETQTENILHEDKEQNTDEEEADLMGTEVTFWYMPLYEGFDEKMSQDLAQEVKEKYGIILNTEVLTWDAGPEKVTVAMATGATPDLYLDTYSRIAPAIGGRFISRSIGYCRCA